MNSVLLGRRTDTRRLRTYSALSTPALQGKCPELWDLAAEEQLVVCVPAEASAEGMAMNRSAFETHILRASPFFAGIYETLNGKTVELEDSVIETREGFEEHRRVDVVFEELHYNKSYKPFRVVCLCMPFQGGSRVVRRDAAANDLFSERASLAECQKFLDTVSRSSKAPITRAQAQVEEFGRSYVLVKGYLYHARRKILTIVDSAADELVSANINVLQECKTSSRAMAVVKRSVDAVIMHHAHAKLSAGLRAMYEEEDARLRVAMGEKASCSPPDFGASNRLSCVDLSVPISEVSRLDEPTTPIDKIGVLRSVTQGINSAVERAKVTGKLPASFLLAADDLLPLLIYVVVHGRPKNLATNAAYSEQWPHAPRPTTHDPRLQTANRLPSQFFGSSCPSITSIIFLWRQST